MHKTISKPIAIPNDNAYVAMSYQLYRQVKYMVDSLKHDEVQWWHKVTKHTHGNETIYYLTDLIIPHQKVHPATTEVDGQSQYKAYLEIKERFTTDEGVDTEALNDFVGHLTCWSHSHGKSSTSPSGQDHKQFKEFISQQEKDGFAQIFLMMIWNQRDELYIRLYDPALGYIWEGLPFEILDGTLDTKYIDDAIANKIEKKTYTPPFSTAGKTGYTTLGTNKTTIGRDDKKRSERISALMPSAYGFGGQERQQAFLLAIDCIDNMNNEHSCNMLATMIVQHLNQSHRAIHALNLLMNGTPANQKELAKYYSWTNADIKGNPVARLHDSLMTEWYAGPEIIIKAVDLVSFLEKKETRMLDNMLDKWFNFYDAMLEEEAGRYILHD